MGGRGSGSWTRYGGKKLVENAIILDVNFLARRRYLVPEEVGYLRWRSADGVVAQAEIFMGAHPDEPVLFIRLYRGVHDGEQFSVPMTATPQNFGGRRWWLHCTVCEKRAAKLYLSPGETQFCCRTCGALTYWSAKSAHQAERALAAINQLYTEVFGNLSEDEI